MTAFRRLWRLYVTRQRRPGKHASPRLEVTYRVTAPGWDTETNKENC